MNGSTTSADSHATAAVASRREDVVVGEQIVRHRLATRVVHWTTALFFFVSLFSGMPIWSPVFGWMAQLFGGLAVCRWLHPWAGVAFVIAISIMFLQWMREMLLEPDEWGWFGPKLIRYLRFEGTEPDVGKYNGGQKILFWAVSLGAVAHYLRYGRKEPHPARGSDGSSGVAT